MQKSIKKMQDICKKPIVFNGGADIPPLPPPILPQYIYLDTENFFSKMTSFSLCH